MQKIIVACISAIALLAACTSSAQRFSGVCSNGYKGCTFSFTLSRDKKSVTDVEFKGYWTCSGRTENTISGPSKPIPVINGVAKFKGVDQGEWFDVVINIAGSSANGTYRSAITGLSCDTYVLKWTAKAK
jgi:hypothetical protein